MFLGYLHFCPNFFVMQENGKVNFKIYDVTDSAANNYNTNIVK